MNNSHVLAIKSTMQTGPKIFGDFLSHFHQLTPIFVFVYQLFCMSLVKKLRIFFESFLFY